jgi:hypothetical protein
LLIQYDTVALLYAVQYDLYRYSSTGLGVIFAHVAQARVGEENFQYLLQFWRQKSAAPGFHGALGASEKMTIPP